jgi:hypothetical protein
VDYTASHLRRHICVFKKGSLDVRAALSPMAAPVQAFQESRHWAVMFTSIDVRFLDAEPQRSGLARRGGARASVLSDAIVALQRQVEAFD